MQWMVVGCRLSHRPLQHRYYHLLFLCPFWRTATPARLMHLVTSVSVIVTATATVLVPSSAKIEMEANLLKGVQALTIQVSNYCLRLNEFEAKDGI